MGTGGAIQTLFDCFGFVLLLFFVCLFVCFLFIQFILFRQCTQCVVFNTTEGMLFHYDIVNITCNTIGEVWPQFGG